jgi:hypothetical protein
MHCSLSYGTLIESYANPLKIAKNAPPIEPRERIRSTFWDYRSDNTTVKLDKDWNMRISLHVYYCDIILFVLDDGLQQVSCSCCQPMDLVDLVVPLICQDGYTVHHTVR